MATVARSVHDVCVAAKRAARELARADRAAKDAFLLDLADRIETRASELLEANAADVDAGREEGLSEALLDRLALTEARVAEMAKGVREIAELDDPVGEVTESWTLPNGLQVAKKRAPLGVVADRLRGAPERHDRRRRPLPQERQRRGAAGLEQRNQLERDARRADLGVARRIRPARGLGLADRRRWPRASWASLRPRRAWWT